MSKRAANRLAWSSWALSIGFVLVALLARGLAGNSLPASFTQDGDFGLVLIVIEQAFATVGALVASRQPENPIGWIFCALGLGLNFANFAEVYAVYALFLKPGSLPGGEIMAWVNSWSQGPGLLGIFLFVVLLFPDGHLLSRRWRSVAWLAAIATIGLFLQSFEPGPLANFPVVMNPFGISSAPSLPNTIGFASFGLFLLLAIASVISLVLKFRRAQGAERQQLKWIAGSGILFATVFLLGPVIWFNPAFSGTPLWPILFVLAIVSIPISIGIAILKYRLYEIDLIIRRTVTYAVVTALLVIVFFGSVILLQQLFASITGSGQNEIVTVLSTLAIAALFIPVRNRVQSIIDRRFNRKKYDAQQVLNDFAMTVRDETDLEKLTGRLIQVVDETMQPRSVSLWLKKTGEPRRRTQ
jgi:hypothetical protein